MRTFDEANPPYWTVPSAQFDLKVSESDLAYQHDFYNGWALNMKKTKRRYFIADMSDK